MRVAWRLASSSRLVRRGVAAGRASRAYRARCLSETHDELILHRAYVASIGGGKGMLAKSRFFDAITTKEEVLGDLGAHCAHSPFGGSAVGLKPTVDVQTSLESHLASPPATTRVCRKRVRSICSLHSVKDEPSCPFIASTGGGWRERYTSISPLAFERRILCNMNAEVPLRCLLVGHNPSDHAWASGTGYSNPSNRFWKLLRESGILPATWRPAASPEELCNNIAGDLGIGITDYLLVPGSEAQKFDRSRMLRARADFYQRLASHAKRAGGAPRIIAFVGKRQWTQCFEPPLKRVESGPQVGKLNRDAPEVAPQLRLLCSAWLS
uniref:Uracil-DNA glycosylase-like domain-containing protein n=1 Tax=Chrysotila carterae TaxID=13221 RepID=A0A7S4B467_CHRCT